MMTNLVACKCSRTTKPYPAIMDTCNFWFADSGGMDIPKALYNNNINYTVHGYFPSELFDIDIKNFVSYENFTQVITYDAIKPYIDPTTRKREVNCGLYREYVKHGFKSGYTMEKWFECFLSCRYSTNMNLYPNICRFDAESGLNVVQSAVNSSLDATYTGCNKNYPYRYGFDEESNKDPLVILLQEI